MLETQVLQGVRLSAPFLPTSATAKCILASLANYNAHAVCQGINDNRANQVARSQTQGLPVNDVYHLVIYHASQTRKYLASEAHRSVAVTHTTTLVLTTALLH